MSPCLCSINPHLSEETTLDKARTAASMRDPILAQQSADVVRHGHDVGGVSQQDGCSACFIVQPIRHDVSFHHKQVIPSAWLRLFNSKEVNELLSGGEGGGVDATDMQRHATYSGGYSADSQTIKLFWKVHFHGLRVLPKAMLLRKVKCCKMLMHRR